MENIILQYINGFMTQGAGEQAGKESELFGSAVSGSLPDTFQSILNSEMTELQALEKLEASAPGNGGDAEHHAITLAMGVPVSTSARQLTVKGIAPQALESPRTRGSEDAFAPGDDQQTTDPPTPASDKEKTDQLEFKQDARFVNLDPASVLSVDSEPVIETQIVPTDAGKHNIPELMAGGQLQNPAYTQALESPRTRGSEEVPAPEAETRDTERHILAYTSVNEDTRAAGVDPKPAPNGIKRPIYPVAAIIASNETPIRKAESQAGVEYNPATVFIRDAWSAQIAPPGGKLIQKTDPIGTMPDASAGGTDFRSNTEPVTKIVVNAPNMQDVRYTVTPSDEAMDGDQESVPVQGIIQTDAVRETPDNASFWKSPRTLCALAIASHRRGSEQKGSSGLHPLETKLRADSEPKPPMGIAIKDASIIQYTRPATLPSYGTTDTTQDFQPLREQALEELEGASVPKEAIKNIEMVQEKIDSYAGEIEFHMRGSAPTMQSKRVQGGSAPLRTTEDTPEMQYAQATPASSVEETTGVQMEKSFKPASAQGSIRSVELTPPQALESPRTRGSEVSTPGDAKTGGKGVSENPLPGDQQNLHVQTPVRAAADRGSEIPSEPLTHPAEMTTRTEMEASFKSAPPSPRTRGSEAGAPKQDLSPMFGDGGNVLSKNAVKKPEGIAVFKPPASDLYQAPVPGSDVELVTLNPKPVINDLSVVERTGMTSSLPELPGKISAYVNNMTDGQSSILIQLEPSNLGKIRFRVSLRENKISAELSVDRLATKGIIEAQLPDIRRSLTEQRIEISSLSVSLENSSPWQDSRHSGLSHNSSKGAQGSAGSFYRQGEEHRSDRQRYVRYTRSDALVDILI